MLLRKFLNKDNNPTDETPEQRKIREDEEKREQEEKDIEKHERRLKVVMDIVRKMYTEFSLCGCIDVYQTFAAVTQTLSLEINAVDEQEEDSDADSITGEEVEQKTRFQRLVTAAVRKALMNLMRRSRAYKKQHYRKDLTLATSLTLTDPFIGIMSIMINLAATTESLLAAEALQQVLKAEQA